MTGRFIFILCWAVLVALAPALGGAGARAQDLSALARLDPVRSLVTAARGGEIVLDLGLGQPVPFRAYLLDDPPRLVVDFREVDFDGLRPEALAGADLLAGLRWGRFRPGWSRLVAELPGPMRIAEAAQDTGAAPRVRVRLVPVSAADFAARGGNAPQGAGGAAASALWDLPQPAVVDAPRRRQTGDRPLFVVLDPGHGGIDPGAEHGALSEAVLVLTFARELKEALTRAGMRVQMTREEDVFVPLETRMTVARAAGADLLLSIHADALAEGVATGATVYLLDEAASDGAAQQLAERHDRADLLAGIDLAGHDDAVAGVLMDLARAETHPRAVRLSQVLAGAIRAGGLKMHKHPVQGANFSVLKAPDIPSILLELGFMSSEADRARLIDPAWRARMAQAIVTAVQSWGQADAAEARLLRQ
ncbi:N-acetylmuramoyl-L-alanine amidase [Pontitalea aquivivens]|uniref:N-acetylmuramoyl-L-alanine amidase n=1 Tax=Pontitalea aquivivens TaxID=3388663 RepID=UPI003970A7A4